MEKRWVLKDLPPQEVVENLAKAININSAMATILAQRDITTYEEAKLYFRPALSQLHDPFLLKDMDKAAPRLAKAVRDREKILIYGDYDVDGTTSVALVYSFLYQYSPNIEYYIPDRYKEGYGVSKQGIDYAIEQGIKLIISLDCGIKAHQLVDYANEHQIDFIICDHHRPSDDIPRALAVLDAKREDCKYPYKELSGCGVGFKLLQAFCLEMGLPQENLVPWLDLVCVSIAADIVPMTGENRILAYFGLKQLSEAPRPGLKALLEIAGIRGKLNISSVVFGIGPRINASGRIAHAHAAVELLLASTEEEALALAEKVNDKNTQRRSVDSSITQEALKMIEEDEWKKEANSTVLFKEDWHKGVIGIVASRCIERYYRPTVILTQTDNKATGSARSIAGFDLYEAIEECSDLLDQFGGHTFAAGLTMPLANIALFQQKFEEVVSRKVTKEMLVPQMEADMELDFSRINEKFYAILDQMEPFGPGNMHPVFISRHVSCYEEPRLLKDQHIKCKLVQAPYGQVMEAIGFGLGEHHLAMCRGQNFDIAYTIEQNDYKGHKTLQLSIKDIKFE